MNAIAWARLSVFMLIPMGFYGCSTNYEIDLRTVDKLDGFKWNGVVRVRCVRSTLFDTPGIDRIELLSQDDRSVLIVTQDDFVKAYLELKTKPIAPPSSTQPADTITPVAVKKN